MTNRNYLHTVLFVLYFCSLFVDKTYGLPLFTLACLSLVVIGVYDYIKMVKIEPNILIIFKMENHGRQSLKDAANGIGFIVIIGLLIIVFNNFTESWTITNIFETNSNAMFVFIITIYVFNIFFEYRFSSCFLTSDGLFFSKDRKLVSLNLYDDYHYEPEHKSFILSKDGVETMELIPKTPVGPHVSVLIDWFESQLRTGK